jgi:hypothetical protein
MLRSTLAVPPPLLSLLVLLPPLLLPAAELLLPALFLDEDFLDAIHTPPDAHIAMA